MVLHLFPERVRQVLERHVSSPHYAAWVTGLAFVFTLTASVPFGSVLVAAILLNARPWRRIVIGGSLAAALASLCLLLVFNSLGWEQVAARFPEVLNSAAWTRTAAWFARYGAAALYLIAALPVPQTPALAFCAIADIEIGPAFVALALGKLTKYGTYGFLASHSPGTVLRMAGRLGIAELRRRNPRDC